MSNNLNEASSSSSESESDSEEEEMTSQHNLPKEPPKQQLLQPKLEESESESDSDSEEEDTRSKLIDLASDSEDETQHNTVKRDDNSKVATKAVDAISIPGKRGREVIGLKGVSTEERLSKKSRDAEVVNDRSQPEKLPSPGKTVKRAATRATRATAASNGKKAKAESGGQVDNARPEPAGRKKSKASMPATPTKQTLVAVAALPAQDINSRRAEGLSSPSKPKKPVTWTTDLEDALISHLYKDYSNGIVTPRTKNDTYWDGLPQRVPLYGLMGRQLYEKVRRMKQRYRTLKARCKGDGGRLFKSLHEERIFQVWAEMWGVEAQGKDEESSSDDEDKEEQNMKRTTLASWTNVGEASLVNQLHVDSSNGLVIPNTEADPYWGKLLKRLQLEGERKASHLFKKVRQMKQRYKVLRKRPEEGGGKLFNGPHERRMFQLWEEIWDSREKTSQQALDEEDSDDESAGTVTPPGQVTNGAAAQAMEESSSSEDEDEEESEELVRRNAAGPNPVSAASTLVTERVGPSAFVSKPLLKSTPFAPKEDKEKGFAKVEEVIRAGRRTEGAVEGDDGKIGGVVSLAHGHLKQLRNETLAFFQDLRGNCSQATEEHSNWGSAGGLGNLAFAGKGFMFPGMQEGFANCSGSQAARELQKKWREHKIQELALFSERLQLMQEHCRFRQEELKLQD